MSDIQLSNGGGLSAKETLRMSLENVAPLINPKTDFANIKGKIEPTRDLILKLIDPFMLSFDTDLVKEEVVDGKKFYTFKAKVTGMDGRTVTGWGKCGTDEVSDGDRAEHDALTKAETRALKRAIEAKAGFGMVNQLILKFFGGFSGPTERNVTPVEAVTKTFVEPQIKETDVGPAPHQYSALRAKAKKLDAEGDKEGAEKAREEAKNVLFQAFGPALDYRITKREDGTWTTIKIEAVPEGAGVKDEEIPF